MYRLDGLGWWNLFRAIPVAASPATDDMIASTAFAVTALQVYQAGLESCSYSAGFSDFDHALSLFLVEGRRLVSPRGINDESPAPFSDLSAARAFVHLTFHVWSSADTSGCKKLATKKHYEIGFILKSLIMVSLATGGKEEAMLLLEATKFSFSSTKIIQIIADSIVSLPISTLTSLEDYSHRLDCLLRHTNVAVMGAIDQLVHHALNDKSQRAIQLVKGVISRGVAMAIEDIVQISSKPTKDKYYPIEHFVFYTKHLLLLSGASIEPIDGDISYGMDHPLRQALTAQILLADVPCSKTGIATVDAFLAKPLPSNLTEDSIRKAKLHAEACDGGAEFQHGLFDLSTCLRNWTMILEHGIASRLPADPTSFTSLVCDNDALRTPRQRRLYAIQGDQDPSECVFQRLLFTLRSVEQAAKLTDFFQSNTSVKKEVALFLACVIDAVILTLSRNRASGPIILAQLTAARAPDCCLLQCWQRGAPPPTLTSPSARLALSNDLWPVMMQIAESAVITRHEFTYLLLFIPLLKALGCDHTTLNESSSALVVYSTQTADLARVLGLFHELPCPFFSSIYEEALPLSRSLADGLFEDARKFVIRFKNIMIACFVETAAFLTTFQSKLMPKSESKRISPIVYDIGIAFFRGFLNLLTTNELSLIEDSCDEAPSSLLERVKRRHDWLVQVQANLVSRCQELQITRRFPYWPLLAAAEATILEQAKVHQTLDQDEELSRTNTACFSSMITCRPSGLLELSLSTVHYPLFSRGSTLVRLWQISPKHFKLLRTLDEEFARVMKGVEFKDLSDANGLGVKWAKIANEHNNFAEKARIEIVRPAVVDIWMSLLRSVFNPSLPRTEDIFLALMRLLLARAMLSPLDAESVALITSALLRFDGIDALAEQVRAEVKARATLVYADEQIRLGKIDELAQDKDKPHMTDDGEGSEGDKDTMSEENEEAETDSEDEEELKQDEKEEPCAPISLLDIPDESALKHHFVEEMTIPMHVLVMRGLYATLSYYFTRLQVATKNEGSNLCHFLKALLAHVLFPWAFQKETCRHNPTKPSWSTVPTDPLFPMLPHFGVDTSCALLQSLCLTVTSFIENSLSYEPTRVSCAAIHNAFALKRDLCSLLASHQSSSQRIKTAEESAERRFVASNQTLPEGHPLGVMRAWPMRPLHPLKVAVAELKQHPRIADQLYYVSDPPIPPPRAEEQRPREDNKAHKNRDGQRADWLRPSESNRARNECDRDWLRERDWRDKPYERPSDARRGEPERDREEPPASQHGRVNKRFTEDRRIDRRESPEREKDRSRDIELEWERARPYARGRDRPHDPELTKSSGKNREEDTSHPGGRDYKRPRSWSSSPERDEVPRPVGRRRYR